MCLLTEVSLLAVRIEVLIQAVQILLTSGVFLIVGFRAIAVYAVSPKSLDSAIYV